MDGEKMGSSSIDTSEDESSTNIALVSDKCYQNWIEREEFDGEPEKHLLQHGHRRYHTGLPPRLQRVELHV